MLDFSAKKVYGPVPEGKYELSIETAEFGQSETGKNFISLNFVVREDVDQPNQGSHIWDSIWENQIFVNQTTGREISKDKYEKLPPNQKGNYSGEMRYADYKIRPLIQAQDADPEIVDENGNRKPNPEYKTSFVDMDEVVLFLNGLNIKATVGITTDNTGKERNTIDYRSISRTDYSDGLPF